MPAEQSVDADPVHGNSVQHFRLFTIVPADYQSPPSTIRSALLHVVACPEYPGLQPHIAVLVEDFSEGRGRRGGG